jgi:hypothetical protein
MIWDSHVLMGKAKQSRWREPRGGYTAQVPVSKPLHSGLHPSKSIWFRSEHNFHHNHPLNSPPRVSESLSCLPIFVLSCKVFPPLLLSLSLDLSSLSPHLCFFLPLFSLDPLFPFFQVWCLCSVVEYLASDAGAYCLVILFRCLLMLEYLVLLRTGYSCSLLLNGLVSVCMSFTCCMPLECGCAWDVKIKNSDPC